MITSLGYRHRFEVPSGRHGLQRLVGVGAVGTVVLGIVLLGESVSLARMMSVAIIVTGIVGLKLSTP